ncbi:hypothetical protein [Roseibium alexandrii]|uniref:hypothetical protein n=1 Tax=Roseibium alexandrii TaxID=388408 RepID=UPI00375342D5
MSIKELNGIVEALSDAAAEFQSFDFDIPTEPRDDASADEWREFGLEVADKLADAEKLVARAVDAIKGEV